MDHVAAMSFMLICYGKDGIDTYHAKTNGSSHITYMFEPHYCIRSQELKWFPHNNDSLYLHQGSDWHSSSDCASVHKSLNYVVFFNTKYFRNK